MGEAVDTIPSILNKCLFVSPNLLTDGRTDQSTDGRFHNYEFLLDILQVRKCSQQDKTSVPNKNLDVYELNRIF